MLIEAVLHSVMRSSSSCMSFRAYSRVRDDTAGIDCFWVMAAMMKHGWDHTTGNEVQETIVSFFMLIRSR